MANAASTRLELWDYISLSSLIILSSVVGIYQVFSVRKSKTATKDFLVTSKELGLFPLILSTVATFFSAIGMLGFPVEVYMNGLSFTLNIFPILIHIPIGCFLYLPVFFKLNRNTIFEYLELRFCKAIRISTSLLLTIQTVLYTAVVMYAPALALNQVTGLHVWASVVSIGIVCIIYTSLGGIKAVVWADVTQFLVMATVIITIIVKGAIDIGGVDIIWDRLKEGKRAEIPLSSSPNTQYTLWTIIIANPIHLIGVVTLHQAFMQRYLSNKTLRLSQISFVGGAFAIAFGQIIIASLGVVMYAYYHDCDPLLEGRITLRDQLVALYAMESLSFCKGLAGVFVAGVMCATLSTLSSTLNTLTAITMSDYVKALKPDLSDETSLKLSRILAVFYGVLCVALVALAESIGGVVKATFGIFSITGGPIAMIFTVGMLLPWVNSKGAMVGFLCSMVLPTWAWIGGLLTLSTHSYAPLGTQGCSNWTIVNNVTIADTEKGLFYDFYNIHAFWYSSWSISVGIIASLIYTKISGGQDPKNVDPDLLFHFMRKYGAPTSSLNKNEVVQMKEDIKDQVDQPLMFAIADKDF